MGKFFKEGQISPQEIRDIADRVAQNMRQQGRAWGRGTGQAARTGFGRGLLYGAGVAAAFAGVTTFVAAMIDWFKANRLQAKSKEYFAKMIEAHPQLKKEKPEIVARYWQSLYHFAPYMAADPLAAGAFIRQSLARGLPEEFGGPPPDTYVTLSDIQQKQKDKDSSDLPESATKELGSQAVREVMPLMAG